MGSLAVTGFRSTIVQEFIENFGKNREVISSREPSLLPYNCDEYLFCAGVLVGKEIRYLSARHLEENFRVNYTAVAQFCDELFEKNHKARVCIIGSMSGIRGSFDQAYAGAKAAMHLYVKTKKLLSPAQQLVAVAPTVIEDSGMTKRRLDLEDCLRQGEQRRRKRWLYAYEVAKIVNAVFDNPAICNTVVEVTGGNW